MSAIPLHDDEHVHLEPRRLDGSEPVDLLLLPYAIVGAHIEDTVASSINGDVTYIDRVVAMPAAADRISVSFSVGKEHE